LKPPCIFIAKHNNWHTKVKSRDSEQTPSKSATSPLVPTFYGHAIQPWANVTSVGSALYGGNQKLAR